MCREVCLAQVGDKYQDINEYNTALEVVQGLGGW